MNWCNNYCGTIGGRRIHVKGCPNYQASQPNEPRCECRATPKGIHTTSCPIHGVTVLPNEPDKSKTFDIMEQLGLKKPTPDSGTEKPETLALTETAMAILVKNLCKDTNATKATMTMEDITLKGELLGSYKLVLTRLEHELGRSKK